MTYRNEGRVGASARGFAATLAQLTVAEKARQLDIFNVADMLTDGRVDPAKAAASWGDLSLGVGTLHDVYAPPALANDIMAFLINASAAKVPPLVGGEATRPPFLRLIADSTLRTIRKRWPDLLSADVVATGVKSTCRVDGVGAL